MTLKYTLIIEGTEKELNDLHENEAQFYVSSSQLQRYLYGTIARGPTSFVSAREEYKVVEPIRIEFTATADELGGVDLIPLKKRRFKTAEELVANRYGIVSFNAYGVVEVTQSGATLRRTKSDTPEGNYSKEWLDVFTCAKEEA